MGEEIYDDYSFQVLRDAEAVVNGDTLVYKKDLSYYEPSDFRISYAVFQPAEGSSLAQLPGDSLVWGVKVEELPESPEYHRDYHLPMIFVVDLPENGTVVHQGEAVEFDRAVPVGVSAYCALYANRERSDLLTSTGLFSHVYRHVRVPSVVDVDTLWLASEQRVVYPSYNVGAIETNGITYIETRYLLVDHD